MAQEATVSETTSESPAEVHKGSGLAVGVARWYIAECKPTRERTVRTMLERAGYEVYVASQVETHVYKSRNRREVERVLLPSRVFVRTDRKNLMPILLTYSSVYRFQMDKAARADEHGNYPFAFVPEDQMRQLQYVLGKASNPVSFTADDLVLDQKVTVMRGPLAGLEGWFYQKGPTSYIVIKVEMGFSHYAYTEIPIEDVQPVPIPVTSPCTQG